MENGYPVELWVFDISQGMARAFSQTILGQQIDGVWHTSIIVYGNEYLYGGGIQGVRPGSTVAGSSPYQKVNLGRTLKSQSQFHRWLNSVGERFSPSKYDLLKHNCNNFTDEASKFLLGKPIPDWITGLPERALSSPLGAMIRPMLENLQSQMGQALPGMQGMFVQPQLPVVNPAFDKEFEPPSQRIDIDEKEENTFQVGDRVVLYGLRAQEYNGRIGVIESGRLETGRWPVKFEIDSSVKAIRASNLRHAPLSEKPKPEEKCPYESLRGLKAVTSSDKNDDRYKRLILKHGQLSNEEKIILDKVVDFVKEKNTSAVPEGYINFFEALFLKVPVKALFSLFALFRNLVSKHKVPGDIMNLLKKARARIPEKNYMVYILFVTTCANLVMKGLKDIESATDIASEALESENGHLRSAGALLAWNIAISVPEDAEESQISLFCCLVEAVQKEKDPTTLNRSLLAIGILARDDETLAQLLIQMEVNFTELKAAGTEKTGKIVQDLMKILKVSKDNE